MPVRVARSRHLQSAASGSAPETPPIGTRFSTGEDLYLLLGPTSAPPGSVTVTPGTDDLGTLTDSNLAGTTFYLLAGQHYLGGGSPTEFNQVIPKAGNTYVGAPGAVLNGRGINRYAFTQQAGSVTIRYLEVTGFNCNLDEFVVNHDSASDWLIEYCNIHHNHGAGVGNGSGQVTQYCWLHHNLQYGFSTFKTPVNDGLSPSLTNVTIDHCEIERNGDPRDEFTTAGALTNVGRNGACKFWDTDGITMTSNWIHDSFFTGVWADTNDIHMRLEGNLIENNWGEGYFYEISYNFLVKNNTFRRNAVGKGLSFNYRSDGFPVSCIYVSESGSESRVGGLYAGTSEIVGNKFVNNWGDITLWENADRFCNSPSNTSGKHYKPLGGAASLAVCNDPTSRQLTVTLTAGSPNFTVTTGSLLTTDEGQFVSGTGIPANTKVREPLNANNFVGGYVSATSGILSQNATQSGSVTMTVAAGTINVQPGFYDCRWHTQFVDVHDNTFDHNRSDMLGPRNTLQTGVIDGKHAVLSQTGTFPSWSPYQGATVQDAITSTQNNIWRSNTYRGDYTWMPHDTGTLKTYTEWRAAPYNQDAGSTHTATPPTGGGGGTWYPPDPPTGITATPGNGEARIHFTPPVDVGGDVIVGYTVTASPGGATATARTGPITVPGLTNNTAYTFTVRARNTMGLGAASAASSSVTPTSGSSLPSTTIPWHPMHTGAMRRSTTSVDVSFIRPASDGGAAISSYTATASPGGATASGSLNPITVTGLTTGTPYTFTVTATNSVGTGPPSPASYSVIP